ncbi:alpha/beta hydrolase [Fulvivirga ligni]|uniref:alpha/beta hydrolase n=1 Tax=Fulvivirga ligni TaxID=2904246 RepID=UPI001F1C2184|nr:alpha/beta hydrolase [Fulvivirga ligni]UII21983.1 alpha/beta hydrolase [Fulvivirga ligni]
MKKILLLIFASVVFLHSNAQKLSYINQHFDSISVSQATYLTTGEKDLAMDIYEPFGDANKKRPVLVYVHGGGFAGGARDEEWIQKVCNQIASHGIVVVSMSYSLTMKGRGFGCNIPAEDKIAVFDQSGSEVAAAVAYLSNHAMEYKIDIRKIVLSGSSAGAEAVLHAAYIDKNKSALPKEVKYAGVISMAGALYTMDDITAQSAIPTQIFHGTCDDLVPYDIASHHYCQEADAGYLKLYGGKAIANKLESLNKGYYMVTGCNGDHGWNSIPLKRYIPDILDFIQYDVIEGRKRQIHEIVPSTRPCTLNEAPEICK